MRDVFAAALSDALGQRCEVRSMQGVGGGCINETARLETSAGPFFAKWNRSAPRGFFAAEAEGLEAIRAAGSGLVVPRPIVARETPAFLLMEYLTPGAPGRDTDERLGRGLAALHAHTAPAFGFNHDGFCGASPQPNGWLEDWPTFWRDRRLAFQIGLAASPRRRQAERQPGWSTSDRRVFDTLLDRLPGLLGPPEPPALIHGDLWGGNLFITDAGAPGVVDPAAYFGHREAELGMMVLFGGFSARVFAAYREARPLAPGHEERLPLYTLYHVLNHYTLFGGGYGGEAVRIARRFV